MRSRSLLAAAAAAVAAAVALAAAAPAHAADPVLAVDITGIHVVDWAFDSGGYPDECQAWTKGSGTQTLGLRTPKPVRYDLLDVVTTKLLLPKGTGRFAGSAQRSAVWREHAVPLTSACTPCGPRSEYGECEEGDGDLLAPLWDCRRRTPKAEAMLQLVPSGTELGDGVVTLADTLVVTTAVPAAFPHCPPDFDGSPVSTHSEQPLEVRIVGPTVRRLMGLRRGQSVTLKGSAELGWDGKAERDSCQSPAGGDGYRECAVTDVTVEVRRLR